MQRWTCCPRFLLFSSNFCVVLQRQRWSMICLLCIRPAVTVLHDKNLTVGTEKGPNCRSWCGMVGVKTSTMTHFWHDDMKVTSYEMCDTSVHPSSTAGCRTQLWQQRNCFVLGQHAEVREKVLAVKINIMSIWHPEAEEILYRVDWKEGDRCISDIKLVMKPENWGSSLVDCWDHAVFKLQVQVSTIIHLTRCTQEHWYEAAPEALGHDGAAAAAAAGKQLTELGLLTLTYPERMQAGGWVSCGAPLWSYPATKQLTLLLLHHEDFLKLVIAGLSDSVTRGFLSKKQNEKLIG